MAIRLLVTNSYDAERIAVSVLSQIVAKHQYQYQHPPPIFQRQNSRQVRRASMSNAKAPWLRLARRTASRRMSVALLAMTSIY
jgi:hypothetical protein